MKDKYISALVLSQLRSMGLDTVELVVMMEQQFHISIPNREAEKMVLVQDFYDTIIRHVRPAEAETVAIKATIDKLIADKAGIDVSEIKPHLSITMDLGMD